MAAIVGAYSGSRMPEALGVYAEKLDLTVKRFLGLLSRGLRLRGIGPNKIQLFLE
jgi:hypothetical protein